MQLRQLITRLVKAYDPASLPHIDKILEIFEQAGAPDEVPPRVVKAVTAAGKALHKLGVR